ncbi:hypothetical protein ACHAXN_009481 [Cyclotella atomus]
MAAPSPRADDELPLDNTANQSLRVSFHDESIERRSVHNRKRGNRRRIIMRGGTHNGNPLPSLVMFVAVAYAVVSVKRSVFEIRDADISCYRQQQQQMDVISQLSRDVHSLRPLSLFSWLLVDAFGLSPPQSTIMLGSQSAMQCHKKSVGSSRSNLLGAAVWGRRKTSHLVCRSTINGETEVQTSLLDETMSFQSFTTNGHTHKMNGANGSSSPVNGLVNDQSTTSLTAKVTATNGKSINGETKHDESNLPTTNILELNTTDESKPDVPMPTEAGGFTHTSASKAKISAANKGKTPWNKGKARSEEVKARIAEGVRRKNRERFLAKLEAEGITEEEYERRKKEKRRLKDAERRARKTAAGGYIPTEETKQKISKVLKEKYASGEIKRKPRDPSTIRKGFKHTEETKAKIAETLRRKWAEDDEYREFMTSKTIASEDVRNSVSVRSRISSTLKKKWEDPEFRASMMEKFKTRKYGQNASKALEHRRKISEAMKKKWEDEEYRMKATNGMAKSRDGAPPRLVKPRQSTSKGTAMRKVDPLKTVVKKKKKKKKKSSSSTTVKSSSVVKTPAVREDVIKIDASPITAMEPMSAEAAREIPSESIKEEEDLPEGSIERLRRDRKDLYDLLYGDDEEIDFVEEPPQDIEDISFTNMLFGGATTTPNSVRGAGLKKRQRQEVKPKPIYANGDSGTSKLASMLDDDGDLDDFDPYGLDNF